MDEQNLGQPQTPQNNSNTPDNIATPPNVQSNNSQINNNPPYGPETVANPTFQNNIAQPNVGQSSNNFQQQASTQPGVIIGDAQQIQTVNAPLPQQSISNYENGYQPQNLLPKKGNSKIRIVAIIAVVIIIFGSLAVFAFIKDTKDAKNEKAATSGQSTKSSQTQNSADAAIDSFIAAITNKDKAKADSLQTKAMQETTKNQIGTTSFYDSCQTEDNFCDQLFSKEYLSSGTVKTVDYSAKDGTKGKQRVYTIKDTESQQNAGSSTSSKSTTTITIATIQLDKNWVIDDFNFESNFAADANL